MRSGRKSVERRERKCKSRQTREKRTGGKGEWRVRTEEGEEERKGKGKAEKRTWSITFWDVAGMQNKDIEFWKGLRR